MGSAEPTSALPDLTTRDQVVRRLTEALERSLADGGTYSELDVETLAGEAGLSRSSFYVYFDGKVELIREIADDVASGVTDMSGSWWDLPADATKGDLRAALGRTYRAYRERSALIGVFVEATAYDPGIREQYRTLIERSRSRIESHIRAGQQNGSVRTELDPATCATWLTALLSRGSHELIRTATPGELAERVAALTNIIWATLYQGVR
jgi:AcrR family transcriptional regulator